MTIELLPCLYSHKSGQLTSTRAFTDILIRSWGIYTWSRALTAPFYRSFPFRASLARSFTVNSRVFHLFTLRSLWCDELLVVLSQFDLCVDDLAFCWEILVLNFSDTWGIRTATVRTLSWERPTVSDKDCSLMTRRLTGCGLVSLSSYPSGSDFL